MRALQAAVERTSAQGAASEAALTGYHDAARAELEGKVREAEARGAREHESAAAMVAHLRREAVAHAACAEAAEARAAAAVERCGVLEEEVRR